MNINQVQLWMFKPPDHEPRQEKILRFAIEGLHVDFEIIGIIDLQTFKRTSETTFYLDL